MQLLVVKLTSMGDLVQALPALTDARRARPELTIDWVVDETFAEVARWHPAVSRVITTAHRRWRRHLWRSLRDGDLPAFWRNLRAQRYDAVIDAQTNLKSAVVTALTRGPKHGPDRATVRERPAHWAYSRHYHIPSDQLAIERWRQLFAAVLEYPVPASEPDFGLADLAWPAPGDVPASPYLIAVPNASWANKHWLDDHWRQLIRAAAEQGYQVCLPWGTPEEREHCRAIVQGLDNARVLPRKTLTELAGILVASEGAICMDTGLAHVAAALDVPTVTLYGPTDPRLIGATGRHSRHIVAGGYDCIPCYRRLCLVGEYSGPQAQCLKQVDPIGVWRAFQETRKRAHSSLQSGPVTAASSEGEQQA